MIPIIVKSQKDLDRHFKIHKEFNEQLSEKRIKLVEKQPYDNQEYEKLLAQETEMDDYGFVYGSDKIHANSCCGGCYAISPLKFCPYCGIKLIHEV